jgi:hypothetical protein
MIYPMMMKIDFQSIKNVRRHPLGLVISTGSSWLIKPFLMFGLASLFFYVIFKSLIPVDLAQSYVTGAVLLGVAPCTAMVFVWSHLTKGDPAYTLVQVAVNDLIILVAFTPIVAFLLGVSNVSVPYDTLLISTVLFVVIPLLGGYLTRKHVISSKGADYFNKIKYKLLRLAYKHRIKAYYALIGVNEIKQAIYAGLHVMLAIPIFKSSFTPSFTNGGYVQIPTNTNKMLNPDYVGDHAVTGAGWTKDSPIRFLNSWGAVYGDKGYGYLPEGYPINEAWAFEYGARFNLFKYIWLWIQQIVHMQF